MTIRLNDEIICHRTNNTLLEDRTSDPWIINPLLYLIGRTYYFYSVILLNIIDKQHRQSETQSVVFITVASNI